MFHSVVLYALVDSTNASEENVCDFCLQDRRRFLSMMFHPTHWWLSEFSASHHNFLTSVSCGGGSKKSKCTRSSIPRAFNVSTAFPKLMRWISGIVLSSNSCLYAQAVYRRKHLPAATRPARPARWFAEAWKSKVLWQFSVIHKKTKRSMQCFSHMTATHTWCKRWGLKFLIDILIFELYSVYLWCCCQ
jgi:hypothetical protein